MTLLAPLWLAAAAVAAGAVVLLHLFARRRPQKQVLPSARFIPPHSAQATTRTVRPTDIALMVLRALLLMAVGAGLSKPVLDEPERPRVGVILADVSRATPDLDALVAKLDARRREGDIVIPFDSAPRPPLAADALPANLSSASGSLSAALIAALDAARDLRVRHDSVELTIISALRGDEIDRATGRIRELWPGRITVDRLDASAVPAPLPAVEFRGDAGDPVAAAVRLHLPRRGSRDVRIVRGGITAEDRQWASDSARVLVDWPLTIADNAGAHDTTSALIVGDAIVVAPFVRGGSPRDGMVIARWADGRPSATEEPTGQGCVRHVVVSVPPVGDLTLRAEFGRALSELASPCRAHSSSAPVSDSIVAALAGTGPLASGRSFPIPVDERQSLAPWLFGFALLLALVEPMVRRRSVHT